MNDSNIPIRTIGRGALYGAGAGVVLTLIYVLGIVPIFGIAIAAAGDLEKVTDAVISVVGFALCVIPFGIVLGMLPGAIVGAVGGALTGACIALARKTIPRKTGMLIGAGVGLGMAVLANVAIVAALQNSSQSSFTPQTYAFWIGAPSLLIAAGMAWVGRRLSLGY